MATPYRASALDHTKTAVQEQSPVKVGALTIYNASNAVAYVQFFNALSTASVTVGSTIPDWVIPIPTVASVSLSFPDPVSFSKGLAIAATTTATGSTSPSSALDVALTLA